MNAPSNRQSGFTLMELLIVVTIVGILSAIAFPAYSGYTTRTRRAAARACVSEAAQYMERYYTTNLKYTDAAIALNCEQEGSLGDFYAITVDQLTQNTYRLVATPVGVQATRDAACGVLTVDQAGDRTKSGTGDLDQCWTR